MSRPSSTRSLAEALNELKHSSYHDPQNSVRSWLVENDGTA
ncbi:hypothetical protein OU415_07555 [Saccharopolyspora sp. WRP15-2]|uniref:Uncharacterized protein n=1 Tax=Saccharopolyspora oryzae TaxID=2997343 RepID=A0ABT4UU87_9PSEU|nr:hypothetical protein [Saccharopolyspora oryzae]MDA3625286.1 hypothetical protein [Saccharopolyspora oryzae]